MSGSSTRAISPMVQIVQNLLEMNVSRCEMEQSMIRSKCRSCLSLDL